MSERNGTLSPTSPGPSTAPITIPAPGGAAAGGGSAADGEAATATGVATAGGGATAVGKGPAPTAAMPAVTPGAGSSATAGSATPPSAGTGPPADGPPGTSTGPVTGRPAVRTPRRSPLTRMGPWAPVAGAAAGLLFGVLVAALLAGSADGFRERLALAFLVVGLTMLGAAGTLLADEVRIVRHGAREAAVRPAWVEATAGLVNGLTPARLLLMVSAFVLFLAAFVSR